MAQHPNFWKIHGERGKLYKERILDEGLTDNRWSYPIHAIHDEELLKKFDTLLRFKRILKIINDFYKRGEGDPISHRLYICYNRLIDDYVSHAHKYHIPRVR